MAGLRSGSYNCSNSVNSEKSYSYVKLTESAYSALTDYLKKGSGSSQKPSIVFEGNEGIIQVPTADGFQKFRFLPENAQPFFECIHQPTQSSNTLHSLGPFTSSLRIQANDDSYEKTMKSMANVMAKNSKNSVKEHQPNGLITRHRPTRPKLCAPPRRDNFASSHISSHPSGHNGNAPSKTSPTSAITRPPPPAKPTVPTRQPAQGGNNKNLQKRSLKQRIIQLLALGPMKKLQILCKLSTDGMKTADKKNFNNLLSSSAVLRDNIYHLHNHLWAEVQTDWPFYTPEEQTTLQNILRSREETTSPNGRNGTNASSSPDLPQKRPPDSASESSAKRLKQSSPVTPAIPSTHIPNNVKRRKAPKTKPDCVPLTKKDLSSSRYHGSSNSVNCAQSPSNLSASSISPPTQASPRIPHANGHSAPSGPTSNGVSAVPYFSQHAPDIDNFEDGATSDLMLQYDWKSYPLQNYPVIENDIERRKYKVEFERIYSEYMSFHKQVEKVKEIVETEINRLYALSEDSTEYMVARAKFLDKYSPRMIDFRKKLAIIDSVEKVLHHLKSRVYEYDHIPMTESQPS